MVAVASASWKTSFPTAVGDALTSGAVTATSATAEAVAAVACSAAAAPSAASQTADAEAGEYESASDLRSALDRMTSLREEERRGRVRAERALAAAERRLAAVTIEAPSEKTLPPQLQPWVFDPIGLIRTPFLQARVNPMGTAGFGTSLAFAASPSRRILAPPTCPPPSPHREPPSPPRQPPVLSFPNLQNSAMAAPVSPASPPPHLLGSHCARMSRPRRSRDSTDSRTSGSSSSFMATPGGARLPAARLRWPSKKGDAAARGRLGALSGRGRPGHASSHPARLAPPPSASSPPDLPTGPAPSVSRFVASSASRAGLSSSRESISLTAPQSLI